jgi:hypothetical protein
VEARVYEKVTIGMCAVAETMTKAALTRLTTSGVGTHSVHPSNSLVFIDMCALMDSGALTAAGFDPAASSPGFAHWYCSWRTAAGPILHVYADRQYERTESEGTRVLLSGHEVDIQPGGYTHRRDRCVTQITNRRFLASNGHQRVERVQIIYGGVGSESPDELCRVATALATNVASKLPPA